MSVKMLGADGASILSIDAGGALEARTVHPYIGSNGAYRLCQSSGLTTGVAAGSASAGHLFSARWSHVSKLAIVTFFRARWVTVAGFTAAQEVGLELFVTRSYTAAHTGGTATTLTGNSMKKANAYGTTTFADMRISTTGALTNGTHTIDTHPIASGGFAELAAGAAVPKGFFEIAFNPQDLGVHPLILSQDMGLILRNQIAQGAGGTARIHVEMDWLEVDSY